MECSSGNGRTSLETNLFVLARSLDRAMVIALLAFGISLAVVLCFWFIVGTIGQTESTEIPPASEIAAIQIDMYQKLGFDRDWYPHFRAETKSDIQLLLDAYHQGPGRSLGRRTRMVIVKKNRRTLIVDCTQHDRVFNVAGAIWRQKGNALYKTPAAGFQRPRPSQY